MKKAIAGMAVALALVPAFALASVQVNVGQDGSAFNGSGTINRTEVFNRLNTLERAVVELQQENAQLRAQLQISQPVASASSGTLEARVSALESKMSGMQQFLQLVVSMLTQILAKLK